MKAKNLLRHAGLQACDSGSSRDHNDSGLPEYIYPGSAIHFGNNMMNRRKFLGGEMVIITFITEAAVI